MARRSEVGNYDHYYANDLDRAINDEGVRRIKAARIGYKGPIDSTLRRDYERDQIVYCQVLLLPEKASRAVCATGGRCTRRPASVTMRSLPR